MQRRSSNEPCRGCNEPTTLTKDKLVELSVKRKLAHIVPLKSDLTINKILQLIQVRFGDVQGKNMAGYVADLVMNRSPIFLNKDRDDLLRYLTTLAERHNNDWTLLSLIKKLEKLY